MLWKSLLYSTKVSSNTARNIRQKNGRWKNEHPVWHGLCRG